MTKDEKTFTARKTLVERFLNRNFKRRQQQVNRLESLRGGSARVADVLAYNPAYGLEDEDPRLGVVGRVAGTAKELSYNNDDFAKDYESFDSDKQVDEDIKRKRAENKEVFRKILLPGLGKTLKNKSTSSSNSNESLFGKVEKARSDSTVDTLSEKPSHLSLKSDSSKLAELCTELEAELEFDSTWDNFTENTPVQNSHSKADDTDNLFTAEQVAEKEQDNTSLLSKLSSSKELEPINVTQLSGEEYLTALLSDDLDKSTFITSHTSQSKLKKVSLNSDKTTESEYNFGKTYDFGNAVRPVDQKFDNHSVLQKQIDAEFHTDTETESESLADLAELQNIPELTESVEVEPEVNLNNAVLLVSPKEEENIERNISEVLSNAEMDEEERQFESLLTSVKELENRNDEEEIVELEKRLRSLQQVDNVENFTQSKREEEILPDKCVEVLKAVEVIEPEAVKAEVRKVISKSAEKSRSTFSRLFSRTNKRNQATKKVRKESKASSTKGHKKSSGGDEVFKSGADLNFDLDKEYEVESEGGSESEEYGRVKPWEVKLDEMEFYASRNLRDKLKKTTAGGKNSI